MTDVLGLVSLLIGALSAVEVRSPRLEVLIGASAPVLVVLGAMLMGGILGSWSTSKLDWTGSVTGCDHG